MQIRYKKSQQLFMIFLLFALSLIFLAIILFYNASRIAKNTQETLDNSNQEIKDFLKYAPNEYTQINYNEKFTLVNHCEILCDKIDFTDDRKTFLYCSAIKMINNSNEKRISFQQVNACKNNIPCISVCDKCKYKITFEDCIKVFIKYNQTNLINNFSYNGYNGSCNLDLAPVFNWKRNLKVFENLEKYNISLNNS
jgi:hypothetical protein